MDTSELFAWGSLGGCAVYIVIFVVPALRAISEGARPQVEGWRLFVIFIIALLYSFVGGVAALLVGNSLTTSGQAIAIGAGGEFALKAIFTGLRDAERGPFNAGDGLSGSNGPENDQR